MQCLGDRDERHRFVQQPALFGRGNTIFYPGMQRCGGDLLTAGIGGDDFFETRSQIQRGLAVASGAVPDDGIIEDNCH